MELRKIDPGISAIVSSGNSNDPILADPETFGFAAVAPKPYTLDALGDVVCRVIGAKA